MKKIFTYSIVAVLTVILFTSCGKENLYDDNSYWLSQERGNVVYSNNYCGFYVVETNYGYSIIQNLDGLIMYDNDVMYGDFGGYGTRNFYNDMANVITRGTVVEYDLSYNEAQNALDYYCPAGRANKSSIRKSTTSQLKASRKTAVKE